MYNHAEFLNSCAMDRSTDRAIPSILDLESVCRSVDPEME